MGIKVQHVNLVMGKHYVEEGGERGNQASPQGVDEEWNLGGCPLDGGARCGPGRRPPPFVGVSGEHRANLVHGFLVKHHRPLNGWPNGRGRFG